MPSVIFEQSLCAGVPTTPQLTGCVDATRIEWNVLDKPVGSQVIISDDSIPEPEFTVTIDGEYQFEVCCYFDEGIVNNENPIVTPELNCPLGVVAGQPATVYLTGCADGNIQLPVAGGVATGATFNSDGVGTVTTDASMPGIATLTVDCVLFDEDGNPTTTQFSCEFEVIPANTQLVCTTAPAISSSFISCGERCLCDTVTVVFDCNATQCESAQIGIVFKDCPPCPDDADCEPLERIELIGSQSATLAACNNYLALCDSDNCFEQECCDPHMPAFHWNNLCTCPGWTLEAPATEGTSIYNTCGCNPGQKWCFEGSATIVASGPAQLVDSLIIWGHNITSGSVTTSPLAGPDGPIVSIGVVQDSACIEGYTQPVVISFADVPESITDLTVTITSDDGGTVCIDQIFIGRKFFLPEDRLPDSFQNPHDGTDYELEYKESECGPLSQSLKHVSVDMELTLDCLSDEWVKENWRPFLRYSQKHGVLFQWSRNRCPNDIFNGWITGPVGPSSWSLENKNTVTISAKGNITQPQPLILV